MPKRLLLLLFSLQTLPLFSQWQSLNSTVTNNLTAVDIVDASVYYAAGNGIFLSTTNGGQNWNQKTFVNASNQPINGLTINDLHFFNTQTGLAVGAQNQNTQIILRTTNGGQNWTPVLTFADNSGATGGLFRMHFLDPLNGYACGTAGKIRKTTDGGLSWTAQITPDNYTLTTIDFPTPQSGYAAGRTIAGEGILLKTSDGGNNWATYSIGDASFTSLDFLTAQNGFLAQDKSLYKYNGAFDSFESLYTPDTLGGKRLFFTNQQTGFLLTDFSVRKTVNSGAFWEESQLPLNAGKKALDFDWTPDGLVGLVCGEGGQLFKTEDGGNPYSPLAIFSSDRFFFCKDSAVTLTNPAPAGSYTSKWLLNGQILSTQATATFTPTAYNTVYLITLIVSNNTVADTFSKVLTTEPSLEFSLGNVVLEGSPNCPANLNMRVENSVPGVSYTFLIGGLSFSQQNGNGGTLYATTPYLTESTEITVSAVRYGFCMALEKKKTVNAEIVPTPKDNLAWESNAQAVCINSKVKITIHNSEPNIEYHLLDAYQTPVTPKIKGNGGDLTFDSPPLIYPGVYAIEAFNALGCYRKLLQTINISVDQFWSLVDTTQTYGIAGAPITVPNPTTGLASVSWVFGPAAQPPVSTAIEPTVTFAQAGTYPYTYNYQSQGACMGSVNGVFTIFGQAPALNAAACDDIPVEGLNWKSAVENPSVLGHHQDAFDNHFLCGYWALPLDLNNLRFNFFLRKYDPAGNLLWSKITRPKDSELLGFQYKSSFGTDVETDPQGNVFVCGSYAGAGAMIAGQLFKASDPFNINQSQGFLMKMSPGGKVLWNVQFTQPNNFENCMPADLLYRDDQHIYLTLTAKAWQATFPDGKSYMLDNPQAEAWLLVFTTNGNLVKTQPIGLVSAQGFTMANTFNPALYFANTSWNTTARSPRMKATPDGALLFSGAFYGPQNITFGNFKATALTPASGLGINHYVAKLLPETGEWTSAYCSHGVGGSFSGGLEESDLFFPAWDIDDAGNSWLAFGLNSPYSQPKAENIRAYIKDKTSDNSSNKSYILKIDPAGNVLWLNRNTNMYNADLQLGADGNAYLLGGFYKTHGFNSPSGTPLGNASKGLKDVFLAKISPNGELIGLLVNGNSDNDQPISMTAGSCGTLSFITVGGLDANFIADSAAFRMQTLRVEADCAADCAALFSTKLPDLEVCAGETAPLAVLAKGSGLQFQWQRNVNGVWKNLEEEQPYNGTTNGTLFIENIPLDLDGATYRCAITIPGGSVISTDAALLTVKPVPVFTKQPQDVTVHPSESAVFSVETTGAGLTYQWQITGYNTNEWIDVYPPTYLGAFSPTMTATYLDGLHGRLFRCIVRSGNGCEVFSQSARLNLTTATGSAGSTSGIVVSPNPFEGFLRVQMPLPEAGVVYFALQNATGQEVFHAEKSAPAGEGRVFELHTEEALLPPGTYWLSVRTARGVWTIPLLALPSR